MPHDHDLIAALNKLPQRVSLYTGLHAGRLLHLLRLPAEIGDIFPFLDYHLIAASCQRQIDRDAGVIIIFRKGFSAVAKADA